MATRMQQRRGTAAEWTSVNPILAAGEIGYETDTAQFKFGDGVNVWTDLDYFRTDIQLDDTYITDSEKAAANGVATLDSSGFIPIDQLGNIINGAPEILDTLNEVASAILDADGIVNAKINTALEDERLIYGAQIQDSADTLNAYIDTVAADTATAITDAAASTLADAQVAIDTAVAAEATAREADVQTLSISVQSNADAISALTLDVAPLEQLLTDFTSLSADVQANEAAITAEVADRIAALSAEVVDRDAAIALEAADREAAITDALASAATDAQTKADAAQSAAEGYADTQIATHAAITTNIHGISDTSVLATDTDVSTAQSAAEAYADTQDAALIGDATVDGTSGNTVTDRISTAQAAAEAHADSAVSTHNSATTSVHGIADTADLALLSAADQTFSGNITVTGDLTISGTTTTVSATDLVVSDPLIYIGEGNTGNAVDLGLVSSFDDGTYQHSGIVRDSSAGVWKLFKGVTDEPTTTINFAQGSLDDLAVNDVNVASVTFSDGTVQEVAGYPRIRVISQKTAGHTFVAGDLSTLVEINDTTGTTQSPVYFTIPADSTYDFPIGATIDVLTTNTGRVAIQGASGVTVNATPGLLLREQWSSATLLKRGANSWIAYGDLSAI